MRREDETSAFERGHAAGFKAGWDTCFSLFDDGDDPTPDEAPIDEDNEPSGVFEAATFEKVASGVPVPRQRKP